MSFLGIKLSDAITGTLIALGVTWLREVWRRIHRRRNIATAIVIELRLYERTLQRLLDQAKRNHLELTAGFPQHLFQSQIGDIVEMPKAFCAVRTAYSYVANVTFLIDKFGKLAREPNSAPQVEAEKNSGSPTEFVGELSA